MNKTVFLSLSMLATAPIVIHADNTPAVNLYGTAFVDGSNALVQLSANGGDFKVMRKSENFLASGGGALIGNEVYLFCNYNHSWLNDVNYIYTSTFRNNRWSAPEYLTANLDATARSLAAEPSTSYIYGCFGRSRPYKFGRFESSDPYHTLATYDSEISNPYNAMGFSSDGTLYAIGADGRLVKVDKSSGAETKIGDTGLSDGEYTSGTIDTTTGTFFYIFAKGPERSLYAVSLQDAKATFLAYVPDGANMLGMYVHQPTGIADKAPGYVTSISDVADESLSTHITFNLPDKTWDGSNFSGQVSYKVSDGTSTLAEGSAAAGSEVKVDLTATEASAKELTFTASKDGLDGPASIKTVYLGQQAPMAVRGLTFTRENEISSLSWEAPSLTIHGRTISADAIRYRVTRQPDNIVVAEALTSTTFNDEYPDPNRPIRLYYEVEALNGTAASAKTLTDEISCGYIEPPYIRDFDDYMVGLGDMTVIDNNHDAMTWYWISNAAWMKNSIGPKDDYLVTEPIHLEADKNYQLTFSVGVNMTDYTDRVEVKIGQEPTVEGLSTTILEPVDVNTPITDKRKLTATFTPQADGLYHIGFHACAEYGHQLIIDDIEFVAPISTAAPAAPTGFAVVPDENQLNKATFTLTAPTTDSEGRELSAIDRIEIRDGENVLHTFTAPQPGAELKETVNIPASGQYSFNAVAYNENGCGSQAYAHAYVGVKQPTPPINVTAYETENEGEVCIKWDCPATDVEGRKINPDLVTYTITDENQEVIVDNLKATEYVHRALNGNTQRQLCYFVASKTEIGSSETMIQTPIFAVGKAYASPYEESFAGDSPVGWATTTNAPGYCGWLIWDFVSVKGEDIYPYDEDNGLLYSYAMGEGLECTAQSGKISLQGLSDPACAFSFWANEDGYDELTVSLLHRGMAHELTKIQSKDYAAESGEGWYRLVFPLSEFKDQNVQIVFKVLSWSDLQPVVVDKISFDEKSKLQSGLPSLSDNGSEPVITAEGRRIIISSADGLHVTVANAAGMTVWSTAASSADLALDVAPGFYIVRAGSTVAKLLVK